MEPTIGIALVLTSVYTSNVSFENAAHRFTMMIFDGTVASTAESLKS